MLILLFNSPPQGFLPDWMCSLFSVSTESVYCCLCVHGRGTGCRSWIASQGPNPWRKTASPSPAAVNCQELLPSGWDFRGSFLIHAGILRWHALVCVVLAAVSSCGPLPCPGAQTSQHTDVRDCGDPSLFLLSCWILCGLRQLQMLWTPSREEVLIRVFPGPHSLLRHSSNLYILQEHCIYHASIFPNGSLKIRSAHI